jgi:hypothetical protein
MDSAEEVLLDPVLVNPIVLNRVKRKLLLCQQNRLRYQAAARREMAAWMLMSETIAGRRHSLAECENSINRGSQNATRTKCVD